jgi:indolepyruvate ferredoxin oxidoreductase beta subunit
MSGSTRPISLAILALGGQGGGVLADWIVQTAESCGWHAQSTSVPGVAQRTGATLYYIEMLPARDGKPPVFALMPAPGDVDIVIAAELMEAGRGVLRGLTDPRRTLLIASSHRAYAVAEKEMPGNGIADEAAVMTAVRIAARRVISFDMEAMARRSGTIISAPLLGALAGSAALPFPSEAFLAAIAAGGRGAAASMAGFEDGLRQTRATSEPPAQIAPKPQGPDLPDKLGHQSLDVQLMRIRAFPANVRATALAGFRRLIDYQDLDYGAAYLSRLEDLLRRDEEMGGHAKGFAFTLAAAKHLANALAYDDVIAVADLKIRASRFERIRREMKAADDPLVVTEFLHPRAEELVSLLPSAIGTRASANRAVMALVDRWLCKGRRIRTTSLGGFLLLAAVAALRRQRRVLLRHQTEMAHLDAWLAQALAVLDRDYDLATGLLLARRLVKGYSDTHARGLAKFDKVVSAAPLLEHRPDAGVWMGRLIAAALKDEAGETLDGALQTIRSV